MGIAHSIGSRSDLVKLQKKRGVSADDVADISKAVGEIEAVKDGFFEDYIKPLHNLDTATKAFRTKFAKKHPKFLSDLDGDFTDPAKILTQQMGQFSRVPERIKLALTDSEKNWKKVLDTLKLPFDAGSGKTMVDLFTLAKSFQNQAMAEARGVRETVGKIDKFEKVYSTLDGVNDTMQKTEKVIVTLVHNKQFDFDLQAVKPSVDKLHGAATSALRLLG